MKESLAGKDIKKLLIWLAEKSTMSYGALGAEVFLEKDDKRELISSFGQKIDLLQDASCKEIQLKNYGLRVKWGSERENFFEDFISLFQLSNGFMSDLWGEREHFCKLAYQDDVTCLHNQRKMKKDLAELILESGESHSHFSLLFIDVDHFKRVNDNYGHMVGTSLLQEIGLIIKSVVKDDEYIYRYGGDEFVVIFPREELEEATIKANEILSKVKGNTFTVDGQSHNLTVSIGVATYPKDAKTWEEVISIADRMMYQAKESGRAQVCHVEACSLES